MARTGSTATHVNVGQYIVAIIGFFAVLVYIITSQNNTYNLIAGGMYVIFLVFVFIKIPHTIRSIFFLAIIYFAALTALLDTAAISSGSLFLLGLITLSVLILCE